MQTQEEALSREKVGLPQVPEVVSPEYVVSQSLCLAVESTKSWWGEAITIQNDHAQRPFTVDTLGYGKVLVRDFSGSGLALLEQQLLALKRTWRVYLGEKSERGNLLYTFKLLGSKSFGVFLAGNSTAEKPDFIVRRCREGKGNRSFEVYYRNNESKAVVEAKQVKGEKTMKVTVHTGVDLAFAATIIVLMDR